MTPGPASVKRFFYLAVIAGLALATPAVAEPSLPVAYQATYRLNKSGLEIARAQFELLRDGEQWQYRSLAQPRGLAAIFTDEQIRETVLMRIEDNRLRPLQYRYERGEPGEKAGQTLAIDYRWPEQSVRVGDGEAEKQIRLRRDTYDTLSLQLAMALALKHDRLPPHYWVFDDLDLEKQTYQSAGRETVKTALGEQATIKVIRRHGSRQTITWFAPGLNYIPVKIVQLKNGKTKSELILESVDFP